MHVGRFFFFFFPCHFFFQAHKIKESTALLLDSPVGTKRQTFQCGEKHSKGSVAHGQEKKKKKIKRTYEMHKEGRDISMATKKSRGKRGGGEVGCYRWTSHLSQSGRDTTLVKNDLNLTRSHRPGTQHEVGLRRAFLMKVGGERRRGKRRKAASGSHKKKTGEISLCALSACQYAMIKRSFFFSPPAQDFLSASLSSPSEQRRTTAGGSADSQRPAR